MKARRAADEGQPSYRRAHAGGDRIGHRPATARRISHVFIMDVPTYPETLFITDAAINIAPDLDAKRDIIQNAIDLFTFRSGSARRGSPSCRRSRPSPRRSPRRSRRRHCARWPSAARSPAVCSTGRSPSTMPIDPEAPRSRASDRRRGPRSDPDRARSRSRQHARQEPDLPAKADAAGLVLGARVPIVLTSRADSVADPLASCAAAVLYADARRRARISCRPRDDHGHDPGRQFRLFESQVSGVRDRRSQRR